MASAASQPTRRRGSRGSHPLRKRKPRRFGDLPEGAWRRIAERTFDQFQSDGVTNLAAALTYRSVLSLFPGLLALVALLGVLGQYPETYDAVLKLVARVAPPSTVQTVSGPLQGVITNKGGASALLGIGLLAAIWAASGYIGTFAWALNVIWEAPRGRSWYRQWPINVAVTIVVLVLLTVLLIGFVVSGPIAAQLGRELGLGSTAVTVYQIAKWPVMALIVVNLIAGLFYVAPNVSPPPLRWISPGAIFALLAWGAMTFAFTEYVRHFGSYNRTYGTLGAIITFLVWVWLTNTAILLGAELDSEIERERELAAGVRSAEERIQLPLRQAG